MAEESQEKKAVTNEDLDAALENLEGTAEEVVEEVQEQQVEEQETAEEMDDDGLPTDHAARTRLGQKMSAYFKKADRLEEMMARLVDLQEKAYQPQQREVDPDETVTYRDLDRYYEERRQREDAMQQDYENSYMKTVYGMDTGLDDTLREEIFNEMYQNFNVKHTDNAAADARINWSEAKAAVYGKRLARPKKKENPLKGEKPRSELGGVEKQSNEASEAPLPKLSGPAADLLADTERRFGADKARELHKKMGND